MRQSCLFCLLIFSRLRLGILIRVDVLITRLFIKSSGAVNVMVQEFNKFIVFSFIRQFSLLGPRLGLHTGDGGGQAAGPGVLAQPGQPRPHGARGGEVTRHLGRGHQLRHVASQTRPLDTGEGQGGGAGQGGVAHSGAQRHHWQTGDHHRDAAQTASVILIAIGRA